MDLYEFEWISWIYMDFHVKTQQVQKLKGFTLTLDCMDIGQLH